MAWKSTHDLALVGIGFRGRVWDPDIGKRHLPHLGDVLHHADDAKTLAVGFDRLPDRRAPVEEALARGDVDDGDEPGFCEVRGPVGPSLDERELQDPPELIVGPLERRFDLLTAEVRVHRAGARVERQPLHARQVTRVGVEQLEAGAALPRVLRPVHHGVVHAERAGQPRLGSHRRERVVEHGRDDHQHEQREADPEQADEGEELPAQQDLHGEREVVFQHDDPSLRLVDLSAIEQPHDPLGLIGLLLIVRHHHDRRLVLAAERLEDPHHLVTHLRVEVAGRLVGEQDARASDDGAGDGDALLLSARELRREVMDARRKAHAVERRDSQLCAARCSTSSGRAAGSARCRER